MSLNSTQIYKKSITELQYFCEQNNESRTTRHTIFQNLFFCVVYKSSVCIMYIRTNLPLFLINSLFWYGGMIFHPSTASKLFRKIFYLMNKLSLILLFCLSVFVCTFELLEWVNFLPSISEHSFLFPSRNVF